MESLAMKVPCPDSFFSSAVRPDVEELLEVTPSPWESLRGARIFLSGASGLFGRWMLESVLWANHRLGLDIRVCALVRNPGAWIKAAPNVAVHPAVEIVRGDVRDCTFPSGRFTHAVHLAASSHGQTQLADPLGLFDVLVGGTRRMLDYARRSGAGRMLYVSSAAVYGRHPKGIAAIDETCREAPDPLDRRCSYDEGKRAAEHLCALYAQPGTFDVVVARPFSVLGPWLPLDWHYAAGNFLRDALAGGSIVVKGDGTPMRSYLYLADVAWWLWVMLVRGTSGRAYNVGSDEAVSIRELAERTARCVSPPPKVTVACVPAGGPVQRLVPSIQRAGEELGLTVRINLDEGLARTVRWLRNGAADPARKPPL